MSEMERNTEVPASTRDEALFNPATLHEESRGAPRNTKGDLTSLRRCEQVPQVDTQLERNPKLPPQLQANHKILTCMLEEAFLHCSISKESPCCLLELKRYLKRFMQLQKFPQIPVPTQQER